MEMHRFVLEPDDPQEVVVSYQPSPGHFTIHVNGQLLFEHAGQRHPSADTAHELKTPCRLVHVLVVEPPGCNRHLRARTDAYRVWIDGKVAVEVPREVRRAE